MIKGFSVRKRLNFKQPAGTSRGVMYHRDVWFLLLEENQKIGIGECAPLPGLSLDDMAEFESILKRVCQRPRYFLDHLSELTQFPSVRCGLEMAHLDLIQGGGQNYYSSDFSKGKRTIAINGLIWMANKESMMAQIDRKLSESWSCLKLKIGSLSFQSELDILKAIRSTFSSKQLEIRVDANGAFSKEDAASKLERLALFDLHSIEQPIKPKQWDALASLCELSPIPIALDEELISITQTHTMQLLFETVKPQYIVIKPSLLGGFSKSEQWIRLAKTHGVKWWITSALESNVGLNAIAQWSAKLNPAGFQGLGTGQLFTNNLPSALYVKSGQLCRDSNPIWQDIYHFISLWLSRDPTISLQTSGSTGKPKHIRVPKKWLSASAQLTAKTFSLKEGMSALLCLPLDYIAGKMMLVRALELGLDLVVATINSNPLSSINRTIDFAAMVPLQLENSIKQQLLSKVKTVIIGGAPLSNALKTLVRSEKTAIIETYGMTETLTHVAIRRLNGPDPSDSFLALDGISFSQNENNCLVVQARHLDNTKFSTNDLVNLKNEKTMQLIGRFDHIINSGGIKISPEIIENKLTHVIKTQRFFIAGIPDQKLGEKIALIIEGENSGKLEDFDFSMLDKYEKPRSLLFVNTFVNTKSGKINRKQTLEKLGTH